MENSIADFEDPFEEKFRQTKANLFEESDHQWIEDRFWIWVGGTVDKIGKGSLIAAFDSFTSLRRNVFAPLLLGKNGQSGTPDKILERHIPVEDLNNLALTIPAYNTFSVINALRNTIHLYRTLRDALFNEQVLRRTDAEDGVLKKFDGLTAAMREAPTDVRSAYNAWAAGYDNSFNPMRDLEQQALHELTGEKVFRNCLEIGCGTGKNTAYLISKAVHVLAADLSEEMLALAKLKSPGANIDFVQVDISKEWMFTDNQIFDLVTFSLVLEHIEDINAVFANVSKVTEPGGYVYVGELHPFKQYAGSRARFETERGLHTVHGFQHHFTDFTSAASANGFVIERVEEYFDGGDRAGLPRILALLLRRDTAEHK